LTNEPGKALLDRFQALLEQTRRFFDMSRGLFHLLAVSTSSIRRLKKTEKIRILVGLKTDQSTFEHSSSESEGRASTLFKSHAEVKEELPKDVLTELEHAQDSAQIEQGIDKFPGLVKSGKLQIKVYPSAKIHAKVYIMTFAEGDRDVGRVVTGSSNFSPIGLT
jgi:hypothetical protein